MNPVPELNIIKKDWRKVDLRLALCYPNIYRVGMAGFSIRLLHSLFNSYDDVLCERFFIPTFNEPWLSLESNQPLSKFDVIAFTLQYEEDYTNFIRMLIESDLPPRRDDRKQDSPLIIAGGPCVTANPEPLANYIDLFLIGEIEPVLDELINILKEKKDSKYQVEELANLQGLYAPLISNPTKRIWIRNLDKAFHPVAQQVPLVVEKSPYMPIFGKALAVEISRGCDYGCNFCLLRHISFPKRERSLRHVKAIINEGLIHTPVDKITLIGASIFDYNRLEEVCEFIVSNNIEVSIPSIRPEIVTEHLADLLHKGKQRTVTIAPDAASPRICKIAKKNIEESDIIDAAKILLSSGIKRLKLYFIVGFPGETLEDISSISRMTRKIADTGYNKRSIHLSVNPLIPKPFTPFQWAKAPSISYIRSVLRILRKENKGDPRIVTTGLDPRHAKIQTFLSLGDRKIGKAIEFAARYGGGLGAWRRAIMETKIEINDYLREKKVSESLPWDLIDVGLSKGHLLREFKSYRRVLQNT